MAITVSKNSSPMTVHSSAEDDLTLSAVSRTLASLVSASVSPDPPSNTPYVTAEGMDNKEEEENPSATSNTRGNTRDGKDLNLSENINPVTIHSSSAEDDSTLSAISRALLASDKLFSLSGDSTSTSSAMIVAAEGSGNKEEGKSPSAIRRKRVRDGDSSTEGEMMSRAELKCQREKKRRRDMNKAFEELVSALGKIDPNIKADAALQDSSLSSSLNRVEVVSRAAAILDRSHNENKEQKNEITELKAKLEATTNEKNEALKLLAANKLNIASASPGIQGCILDQGVAALLQSALIQSSSPAVPTVQLPLDLSVLSRSLGAQGTNMQLSALLGAGNNIGGLSTSLLQRLSQTQPGGHPLLSHLWTAVS